MERQNYQLQWASKDLGQETRIALGRVTSDKRVTIVAGTTSAVSQKAGLYCFRYSGNTYDQIAKISLDFNVRCIKAFDIDKDGIDEIIVGSDNKICIYKLRENRLVKTHESTIVRGSVVSIAIGDIDRDGRVEIIVAVKGRPKVYIFRYDGTLVFVKNETFDHNVYCVAIGDTDGDGQPELVIRTVGMIYVLGYTGTQRSTKWSTSISDTHKSVLIVDDLNKDGRCEIICDLSRNVKIFGYKGRTYSVIWESPQLDETCQDAIVADIDNNGERELVIITISSCYIYGWKNNRIILEWKQTIPNGAICVDVGDLVNNGIGEIVIGTVYGYIHVLEARRDRHRKKLWVGKVQSIIQDTVTIPFGKPDAERGIEAKARFTIDEVKVIWDKVIVDGEVTAKILYVAALPSQPVHFFEATFPFLDFIHLYGAQPGMEAIVFFKVEHINVDALSPRTMKITILFEMTVQLVPFCFDP